jgi:hypothetical protein
MDAEGESCDLGLGLGLGLGYSKNFGARDMREGAAQRTGRRVSGKEGGLGPLCTYRHATLSSPMGRNYLISRRHLRDKLATACWIRPWTGSMSRP